MENKSPLNIIDDYETTERAQKKLATIYSTKKKTSTQKSQIALHDRMVSKFPTFFASRNYIHQQRQASSSTQLSGIGSWDKGDC